eukprot:1020752-Pyramimonas_sp.AAC.1
MSRSAPKTVPSAVQESGLRDYETVLQSGEYLLAAIAAGGAVEVTTSGEAGFLFTSVPTWVTILLPADADMRAAAR